MTIYTHIKAKKSRTKTTLDTLQSISALDHNGGSLIEMLIARPLNLTLEQNA